MKPVKKFKQWNSELAPEKKLRYVGQAAMLSWAYIWATDMIEVYTLFVENAESLTANQISSLTVANTGTKILFMFYLVFFLGIPGIGDLIEGIGKIGFNKLGGKDG